MPSSPAALIRSLLLLLLALSVSATPRRQTFHLGSNHQYTPAPYVPKCNVSTPFVVFDPPVLEISDREFDKTVMVRLAKKPEGIVKVFFMGGRGVLVGKGEIVFGEIGWEVPQPLQITATPDFYKDPNNITDFEITVTVDAPCESYAGCQQIYGGKRHKYPGATCTASGDPHYVTFDGLKVTHMGKGVFSLVESAALGVQVYQYPCLVTKEDTPTCIGGVAVRYGESAAIISVAKKDEFAEVDLGRINSPRLTRLSKDLEGIDYSPRNQENSDKWTLNLADGSTITIEVGSLRGVSWLDVSIMLPSAYYGKVGGLCNVHDEKHHKKLVCSDGKTVGHKEWKDVNQWAMSWKVADVDNMFLGAYKEGWKKWPLKDGYKPTKGCLATTFGTCPPKTTTTRPVYTTSTVVTVPVTSTVITETTQVATLTSTKVVYVTSSSSVYSYTSTQVYTTALTSSVPIVSTTFTKTTVPVYETTFADTTGIPMTTTSTSTKTPCTLPPYKPTEYTYQTPTATPKPPTYTTLPSYNQTHTTYTIPISPNNLPPTPQQIQTAEQTCKSVMTIPGCDKICPAQISQAIHTCVTDVLMTNSYAFTETTRRNLATLCETLTGYAVVGENKEVASVADAVVGQAGFGQTRCLSDCSGRGVCESGGCRCVSPFTGVDCSIDKRVLGGGGNVTLISNGGGILGAGAEYPVDELPKPEETKPKTVLVSVAASAPNEGASRSAENVVVKSGAGAVGVGMVGAMMVMSGMVIGWCV
ncbi:hypothetical protein HDU67_006593 [Dinochytrium kinnereticum]|nr:hypothetical protein HDU67_006593 [Dinochytrium kinnereticum]